MWVSVVDEHPPDATAAARFSEPGRGAGFVAAWSQRRKPQRGALRANPTLVDPGGEPASVSLVLAPGGLRLPFDDPAVLEARRQVLARPPLDGVSALLRDASHFVGSITVARGADAIARLVDDPFARIFPARLLQVGGGLFGSQLPPAGPAIERYGSANPWPGDRFEGRG